MISVIIPVYNVEKYIAQCIESVINQTYRDLEIIVVNDATPDNSMAIVEEYAAKDSRIHIINNPRNLGLMTTRKNGFEFATGKYLMFVDSDDYLPLNAIETLYNAIVSDDYDMAVGKMEVLYENGDVKYLINALPFGSNKEGLFKSLLSGNTIFSLCAKLFKSKIFKDDKLSVFENLTMAEDKCLMIQLANNINKSICIDSTVYYYKKNNSSITESVLTAKQVENIIITHKLLKEIASSYPTLRREFYEDITFEMIFLFIRRHKKCNIRKLISEHSMTQFISLRYLVDYLSWGKIWIILKTYLYNKLHTCKRPIRSTDI